MHIAIIGGGISGLSLYLWLRKLGLTNTHTITVYEARSAAPATSLNNGDSQMSNASFIGGGLGFSPVGLRVLRRLNPELEQEILRLGHWMGRWKMSNARGWNLGETEVVESGGGVFIGRTAFWQCLRRRVPDDIVVGHKKVVEVSTGNDTASNKCRVLFEDGTEVSADLVAGCDGIWSKVRKAVLGEDVKPVYQGLTGVGGFVPGEKLGGVEDGEMNVVFGANGFFGYGYSSSEASNSRKHGKEAGWWSTYTLAECPTDWRHIDREDVKAQLTNRHRSWRNDVIQNILEDVKVSSVYPTFTTPDLSTWERGGCVLLGDSAHALQPSSYIQIQSAIGVGWLLTMSAGSGQGASMALEDCEILAMLLAHQQDRRQDGWRLATKLYSDMRIPRLRWIRKEAEKRGGMKHDMGVAQEMLMYFFIWLSCKTGLFTRHDRELSGYDVPTEVQKVLSK